MNGKYLICKTARDHLLRRCSYLPSISLNSVRLAFKKKLSLRFKKMNVTHPSNRLKKSKIKVYKSVSLQLQMEIQNVRLVYVDELKYSTHSNKFYGWTKKGKNGYLSLVPDDFELNLIIVI
jgi:hypothetical protein